MKNFLINMQLKNAKNFIEKNEQKYEVTQDWTGGLYISIELRCNYNACLIDIYITGYVQVALHKFITKHQNHHSITPIKGTHQTMVIHRPGWNNNKMTL